MNFSDSAIKSNPFPDRSENGEKNIYPTENDQHIQLPEDGLQGDPSDKQNDSPVYDLPEFIEAKTAWIKHFFYSKKKDLKKLIGYSDPDKTDNSLLKENLNIEKGELRRAEKDIQKYLETAQKESTDNLSHTDLSRAHVKNVKASGQGDLSPDNFKSLKADFRKFAISNKQSVKEFAKANKEDIKGFVLKQESEINKYFEKQKSITGISAEARKKETKEFLSKTKKECDEFFDLKIDDLDDFFANNNDQVRKVVSEKNAILKTLVCADVNRKKTKQFIKGKQAQINEYLKNKEKKSKKYTAEKEQNIKESIDNRKKSLKENTKSNINYEGELQALIESNKQEMKDFLASQKDLLKLYLDSNKIGTIPQTFSPAVPVNEFLPAITHIAKPVTLQEKQESGLNRATKILLAEDDLLLRKSLSFYLTHNGFEIVQVTNGLEAMEEIYKTNFDLIILDLQMPHMGGLEIIDRVRNQLHQDTKIIVLTASGVEEVELKSFSMGATDFISKPFSPSVVKARIEKLMTAV